MLLSKDANGFISTAQPNSADALTERKANFDLSPSGTLTGTVHVVFHGQEALAHRLRARNDDEVTRREDLEKEIKGWLSSGADIKLEKLSGWDSSEDPLQTDFHVEMPGFAGRAGHRLVLPVEVFQVIGAQFEHATRSYPIYFDYPYQEVDEVNIHLPPDLEIENLPTPEKIAPGDAFLYELQAEHKENAIIVHRRFQVNSFYLETGKYPAVKEFFRRAKSQDEGQAVLRPLESHAVK